MSKAIIDISHHQQPSKMDYDKLAQQVSWVIVRTQYGLETVDKYYKTHHVEFKNEGYLPLPMLCFVYD